MWVLLGVLLGLYGSSIGENAVMILQDSEVSSGLRCEVCERTSPSPTPHYTPTRYCVAVRELKLNHYNPETLFYTI